MFQVEAQSAYVITTLVVYVIHKILNLSDAREILNGAHQNLNEVACTIKRWMPSYGENRALGRQLDETVREAAVQLAARSSVPFI